MLRAIFIALSESRSLRAIAEHSRFGQRTSARFVAGTEVADAIRAAAAMNKIGAGVSIDNLGENVTNADEARASAQLYHHLLDEIAAAELNANISLKLTHMGLDVDEKMAYEIVRGLVAKAAKCRRRILFASIWKARPTPSVPSTLFTSFTGFRGTQAAWER